MSGDRPRGLLGGAQYIATALTCRPQYWSTVDLAISTRAAARTAERSSNLVDNSFSFKGAYSKIGAAYNLFQQLKSNFSWKLCKFQISIGQGWGRPGSAVGLGQQRWSPSPGQFKFEIRKKEKSNFNWPGLGPEPPSAMPTQAVQPGLFCRS